LALVQSVIQKARRRILYDASSVTAGALPAFMGRTTAPGGRVTTNGAAPRSDLLQGYEPTSRPIWLEALFPLDWLALHCSPVYYGFGVPRGNGEAVVLVPGFLGDDRYLTEMHLWLRRIGYRPYFSGIGRNVDCPDLLTTRLVMTVKQAYADTKQPVSIVGHSLGGMLARAAGHREPDMVKQVITMGSPFRSVRAHPLILSAANFVRANIVRERKHRKQVTNSCFTPQCNCEFVTTLLAEPPAEDFIRSAIYSKVDGVVDWRSCIEDEDYLNSEVTATHIGMAFNPDVYRTVATLLANGAEA
jgi:pimeloyl-ACP methyl ester carboxylesterase